MANNGSLMASPSPEEAPDPDDSITRDPRISASSSWKCHMGLASVLRVVPEEDLEAGELWGPPQNCENVVVLEGFLNNENIAPCFLYLHCDSNGSEEITSLGIISEARNMELYVGEEYCATGRGEKVLANQNGSKNDQVTLYKKYLKLECPTTFCKVKLLSIKGKNRVLINRILVQVSTKPLSDFSTLESGIDMDRVQAIMESMGSKLSPGAQQLLDMVHLQQKHNAILSQNDFKGLVSSFLQQQTNENSNAPSSTFLFPFLQTVCGQVNRLRTDEKNENYENKSACMSEDDTAQTVGVEHQPICLYLEKIISRHMELMEKRLTDYIDLRVQKLQEQFDSKVAAIMGLIQNSKNITQDHDPVEEGNSSGNT
ncbi:ATPase PAAT isoform X2 [Heteronotia binoei]|uniref:ATPase PAAT isoform X2 n=1 Tax=Heteronotia binoei TaxID=13085 RepID=UPI002930D063|nr:ATPase PAAT isoform X2 [Heteronotia binoei]